MTKTQIDFEITSEHVPYEYVSRLVKKICEEHENERALRIKINLTGIYLDESDESKDAKVS